MSAATRAPKRGRRIMDPAEREAFASQRREEDRERIESSVRQLLSSDGWRQWAETRARFHTYSLCNSLLIAMQCPEASAVAGYRTWQGLGRHVRKGETGIRIMAPMSVRKRQERDTGARRSGALESGHSVAASVAANRRDLTDTAGEGKAERITLFKAVPVFDISQTDGEDLPAQPSGEPLTGDSHAGLLSKLEAFAGEIGFSVESGDLPRGTGGVCSHDAKRIVLANAVEAPNARVRVLVHELAHALGVKGADYGRETAEAIVETAAMIACGAAGLDTSETSIPYVAGWAEKGVDALKEYAAKTCEIAKRLETAMEVV